ncbi:GDSL esterase/lipase At1g54790 isoform X1 [Dendrobium catenatum]|uniref:GDSL esterase/lipase At1g54790 isoform X1 n=1 Tax=Dendrobium catenatum TaxID=906689 RepID=UPI00109F7DCE|nr:GDSL esterase/lipase At1g54790 isoform X1 [Dendrobium catenatum]
MAVPRAPAAVTLYLFISVAAAVASASAVDFNYPAVFNFGDSNSDTGGLVAGIGDILDPPYGQTYFRRPAGRFCDGRLIIDFLRNKFKKYIPPADFFSRGLYMFDIGQNDLAGAFYSKSEDQIIASIPTILLEFETGVKKLYDQGARNFWIHNTGPLGCLAQNVAQFGKDPSKLDEYGCVSSHNRAAKLFNLQLHALCTKLQAQFVDANVTYIDIFTIKSDLIANYSRYGFEHPVTVCCGYGGPPLNYDSRIRCGQTKILDGSSVTAKGCSDATDYVNWDGIHYTDAANQFVSSQILTGKYSDPPFSDKMPFLLKLKF